MFPHLINGGRYVNDIRSRCFSLKPNDPKPSLSFLEEIIASASYEGDFISWNIFIVTVMSNHLSILFCCCFTNFDLSFYESIRHEPLQ